MKYVLNTVLLFCLLAGACKKTEVPDECGKDEFGNLFPSRNFSMGFTTWPFGGEYADRESTYAFIKDHADIYSEQFDNYIPWRALINRQPYPQALTNDIASRLSLRPAGHKLLVSVSLLNIPRDELLADADGFIPAYTSLDDSVIINAYTGYLKFLVDQFHPDYLVLAMEVNEFRIKRESKWAAYKSLVSSVKANLKIYYPDLKMAESITLHNYYLPEVGNPEAFIAEITDYVNNQDFAAISFYPFLKGQHSPYEFNQAFDFLHSRIKKPIAFVETGHIAEDLNVPAMQLAIKGDQCEQQSYLQQLLLNARAKDYEFIIWWTHRDYDRLWQIFPPETKDLGLLWKDTGLVTGEGGERPALKRWKFALGR